MSPPDKKRQRTGDFGLTTTHPAATEVRSQRSAFLNSLYRGISPPGSRRSPLQSSIDSDTGSNVTAKAEYPKPISMPSSTEQSLEKAVSLRTLRIVKSPFKLTRIRDLPPSANVDTISLRDILGDVMLKEVWLFDFLFDVDWVM